MNGWTIYAGAFAIIWGVIFLAEKFIGAPIEERHYTFTIGLLYLIWFRIELLNERSKK